MASRDGRNYARFPVFLRLASCGWNSPHPALFMTNYPPPKMFGHSECRLCFVDGEN
jgi:hypothetical protein